MIKCEVISRFDLKDLGKLKNIQRKSINVKGSLFVGDTFECDKEMADYLLGNNALNKTVVKVVEVELKDDKEGVIPLENLKELDKMVEQLNEHIEVKTKTPKKKKTSKK